MPAVPKPLKPQVAQVGADVAVMAGLGLARLPGAEPVTAVALLARSDRAVRRRLADLVTALAGQTPERRAFKLRNLVAGLVRREMTLGDGHVLRQHLLGEFLARGDRHIDGQTVTTLDELRQFLGVTLLAHRGCGLGQDTGLLVGTGKHRSSCDGQGPKRTRPWPDLPPVSLKMLAQEDPIDSVIF